jgi:hypothetical protein
MGRIICRTVCTAESTMECHSAISHTFHNDIEKQNPYQSESQSRCPQQMLASFSSLVYIISVRDSEGNMLGNVHASMTYGT